MDDNNEIADTHKKLGGLPFIITEADTLTDEEITKVIAPANRKLMQSAICHN